MRVCVLHTRGFQLLFKCIELKNRCSSIWYEPVFQCIKSGMYFIGKITEQKSKVKSPKPKYIYKLSTSSNVYIYLFIYFCCSHSESTFDFCSLFSHPISDDEGGDITATTTKIRQHSNHRANSTNAIQSETQMLLTFLFSFTYTLNYYHHLYNIYIYKCAYMYVFGTRISFDNAHPAVVLIKSMAAVNRYR